MMWPNLVEAGKRLSAIPMGELDFEFPPMYHDRKKAQLTLSLDEEGNLLEIVKEKKPADVLIPVTLDSAKRTNCPEKSPHGLCEMPANMQDDYVAQLTWWADFANDTEAGAFVSAVCAYVTAGTLMDDVENAGGDSKSMIRWKVGETCCWQSEELMRSWEQFYGARAKKTNKTVTDMITGETDVFCAMHPKALLPGHANGKLISAGDKTEFTWRGQFFDPEEACAVGSTASHLGHQAFKYLFAHNSMDIGNDDRLCVWTPLDPRLALTREIFSTDGLPYPWDENFAAAASTFPSLADAPGNTVIITMIAGGATTGRISVKYYEESTLASLKLNVASWLYKTGFEVRADGEIVPFFPSINYYIDFAFGSMISGKRTASDAVRALWKKRLLRCVLFDGPIPEELTHALYLRALRQDIYGYMILPVALSALRKSYIDQTGEVYEPMVDENNSDRSYLYGRLLYWFEAMERRSLNTGEPRLTTAERWREEFARKPATVTRKLQDKSCIWARKLQPGLRAWFYAQIGAVVDRIDDSTDKPLESNFLFGYYAQKSIKIQKEEQ